MSVNRHRAGTLLAAYAYANSTGAAYTTTGDAGVPKLGCVGHRDAAQQALLAAHLAPVIAYCEGRRLGALELALELLIAKLYIMYM